MKISFLTSTHINFDDRVYYHLAYSLLKKGHKIEIISSDSILKSNNRISFNSFNGDLISRKEKIKTFIKKLSLFKPQVIICSEPLTVIAAKKYAKDKGVKIIYDITEWYPSNKNLVNYSILTKGFHFFKYILINIYAGFYSDGFIFGEYYKSKPFKILFSNTPFVNTTYYPKLNLFKAEEPSLNTNKIRLSYSGKISIEKGFVNFLNVLNQLLEINKDLEIELKIIGWYYQKDKKIIQNLVHHIKKNIDIVFYDKQSLKEYINLIKDTDIFMDLRKVDFENTHCLPIKIFYYMALERPVIYSNLKAIRKEVEISEFGYLVNPKNSNNIAKIIIKYLNNNGLYHKHCANSKDFFKKYYNWEIIEESFVNFIEEFEKI